MGGISDYVKNAKNLSEGRRRRTNSPSEYSGRRRQYYADVTAQFMEKYGKYASDAFEVRVQGLCENDFFAWSTQRVRMSDISDSTLPNSTPFDDYKIVLFEDRHIDYCPIGAKFEAMGDIWLCTNPQNIASAFGTAVIRRCNAVWNYLDYYGNLKSEPIIVENMRMLANDNAAQEFMPIAEGYFNVIAQYNPETACLSQNSRMILGRSAYAVTGISDFSQEFTGDYDSVRLIYFSLRRQETNDTDDMISHVAGGKVFSWDIDISGVPVLAVGQSALFTAESTRCEEKVPGDEKHPVSYVWESSNESIAAVDYLGNVTGRSAGNCVITASLTANFDIKGSFEIEVVSQSSPETVAFIQSVPESLSLYESVTLSAACFENGVQTDKKIVWEFSGADSGAYLVEVLGNSVKITCFCGDVLPLIVTAKSANASVGASIELLGI